MTPPVPDSREWRDEVVDLAYARWKPQQPNLDELWVATLREEITDATAQFAAVMQRFKGVYGLRLPRHLAAFVAFRRALQRVYPSYFDDEDDPAYLLAGVSEWFDRAALRKTPSEPDERLTLMCCSDPVECVPFALDGRGKEAARWSLWFDDPAKLPTAIVRHGYGWVTKSMRAVTALDALRNAILLDRRYWVNSYMLVPEPRTFLLTDRHVLDLLKDAREFETELLAKDQQDRSALVPFKPLAGGICPPLPGCSTDIPDHHMDVKEVDRIYDRSLGSIRDYVASWVDYARVRLEEGDAGPAWIIGHEMHWRGFNGHVEVVSELLLGAYNLLGRPQLADRLRLQLANREKLPGYLEYNG